MQFQGYRRPDGRVGIRNHVVVMPGCLCSSVAAKKICQAVEGVTFLENPNGCAQNSRDTGITLEILSGLIANGNVYGVLIVGNGCETIQEERYRREIAAKTCKPVEYISIQGEGGLGNTVNPSFRMGCVFCLFRPKRSENELKNVKRSEIIVRLRSESIIDPCSKIWPVLSCGCPCIRAPICPSARAWRLARCIRRRLAAR